jgi:hypothetical protein
MKPKHKGAWAEAVAKAYLLRMGFEVFENVSQHGSVDFIALSEAGDVGFFDVKLASVRRSKAGDGTTLRFHYARSEEQEDLNVQLLHVTPGGNVLTTAEAKLN